MESYTSRKGIILAGGYGNRLLPLTKAISKQLLPIYDKPMIYYPLSILMLSGIKEFLIISNPENHNIFKQLLGDGTRWGIKIHHEKQIKPEGIAQALLIGEDFINRHPVAIALGDNLFHGQNLLSLLNKANSRTNGATIFVYPVKDPEKYGIVQFDKDKKVLSLQEKPINPLSQYAITGLYFYDNTASNKAKNLTFSSRGELEITSLNQMYLDEGNLYVETMGRGMAWLDTGSFDSLQEAGAYVKTLENRQGLKIGSPEEVSWRKGWINDDQLEKLAKPLISSGYGQYLLELINKKNKEQAS